MNEKLLTMSENVVFLSCSFRKLHEKTLDWRQVIIRTINQQPTAKDYISFCFNVCLLLVLEEQKGNQCTDEQIFSLFYFVAISLFSSREINQQHTVQTSELFLLRHRTCKLIATISFLFHLSIIRFILNQNKTRTIELLIGFKLPVCISIYR